MELFCFDTHLLIWGVQGKANKEQKEMIQITKDFIKEIDSNDYKVLLPSLVVAEFSLKLSEKDNIPEIMSILTEKFIISSFDLKSANYFRQIWHRNKERGYIKELRNQNHKRETIKIDMLIIAEAIANNASKIISHDEGLIKLAEYFIPASKIPELNIPLSLPIKY